MIDLSTATEGTIGDGTWFSDIFYVAVRQTFTGGVLIHSDDGDCTVFFRNGSPVHAAGSGFRGHHLGELLVKGSKVERAVLEGVIAKQAEMGGEHPVLGTLLVANAGVSPDDIKAAIQNQTALRVQDAMRIGGGKWQAAPGENARIRDIGVSNKSWAAWWTAMISGIADQEMRHISNELLGHSVCVRAEKLPPGFAPEGDVRRLLHYLEKPRKPDQLERALRNRKLVRGFFRALEILGALDKRPVGESIPIPKATLLKGQQAYATVAPVEGPPQPQTPVPRHNSSPRPPKKIRKNHPIVKEVNALHGSLGERNHFELLGATEQTSPSDLRSLFTALAKKYHPDALPNDVPEEAKERAKEISARINDAYQTLNDDEKRAHYLALLNDDRIKGDARKAELIREADIRCKKGLIMLKKREYPQAREFFKYAMEADPSSGEYKAHFAWSLFADTAVDRSEAIATAYPLLLEALKITEANASIHYYAGQVLKAMDKPTEALHHFREALRADRRHTEAEREFRLLKLRAQKSKGDGKNKGALSKLFKRS